MPRHALPSAVTRMRHRWAAATCLIAASLVVISQLAPFDQYGAWLWGLALVALGTGAWMAMRSTASAPERPRH